MVQEGGTLAVIARAVRIEGPTRVTLVGGQRKEAGFKLWLREIRRPSRRVPLQIKWHVIGQFRYFDPRRWKPTLVGTPDTWGDDYIEEVSNSTTVLAVRRGDFTGSVQGRPRSHPESQLVRRFVVWLDCERDMEQHWLMPDRFQTDLFDVTKWRLIEAKVACDRAALRSALGQLYDYKRFYRRRPSLGVLVATRPSRTCVAYLRYHRVTAVWETPSGKFGDSAGGLWSRLRRRA